MKVGVVIPAFNAAATVADTIASLQAQTLRDWVAVVVDDGSTDDTAPVVAGIAAADSRITLHRQANAGEAAARNAGLAQLTTDWVAFLDADDQVTPTWLERLSAEAHANSTLDVVHCRWARVAADGTVIPAVWQAPSGDLFAVWARRSAFPVHAAIVRRTVVDAVGGFDITLEKSADWDLWQRVARTGARFGAVPEVMALYRMGSSAASMAGEAMLRDGLTVLARGHAPDPRVTHPAPAHAEGRPPGEMASQVHYLLAWCAGVMLGHGHDPRVLLRQVSGVRNPELDADAIAECLLDSLPLPSCAAPAAWEHLWPAHRDAINLFLVALESAAEAPGLAERARLALARQAALRAPAWHEVMSVDQERIRSLVAHGEAQQEELDGLRHAEEQHQQADAEQREAIGALRSAVADLTSAAEARERAMSELSATLDVERREAERGRDTLASEQARAVSLDAALSEATARAASLEDALHRSEVVRQQLVAAPEYRMGDFFLNRLQMRRPATAVQGALLAAGQGVTNWRLRWDRWRNRNAEPRILATVCSTFPIYSQTFVHQELASMVEGGFPVRVAYSTPAPFGDLGGRFESLWPARRRLEQHRASHRRHLAHFRRRMPARVDAIIDAIVEDSGLTPEAVREHGNVLEGFTHARMAEVYGARYLHSYFFYDRSLMTLIAAELLDLPRGISCYADHMLRDYELKLVPLQLRRAALVVATSERIRDELLALAPGMDAERILIKPNGIDCRRFPVVERAEPGPGLPHRLAVTCRIEPKKGLIELVEAMALLRQRGTPVELHVIGAADEWSPTSLRYKAALDQRIGELDLWGTVHLEGRHDHAGILRFLNQSHLFVAPFVETDTGDKDGIPTALLEGMATGLPVVATTAGSIPEVVRDGSEGALVPQRDPVALADAIGTLLARDTTRRAMADRAAARIRDVFDVSVCEAALHRRIREVVAGGPG